jgi:anti-sigma factor RsiW
MNACSSTQRRLSSYLDGQLPPDERGPVSDHLAGCTACQGVARDLERVRATARQLGPVDPPDHIWLEVMGQIRMSGPQPIAPLVARAVRRRFDVWQMAGLAAALLLITMGIYLVQRMQSPPPGNAPAQTSVQSVADELTQALEHYDKAIVQLQTLAASQDSGIDPAVAQTIEKNLRVIDRAIADSRAALSSDPQSEPARVGLMEALRQKVGLLTATIELMNEMRQGNEGGAARVLSGRKS